MKKTQQVYVWVLMLITAGTLSCVEEMPDISGRNHIYHLKSQTDDRIRGQVLIRERNGGTTQLELTLSGVRPDAVHPAYIHFNNALEGGGIAITLTPVDGISGTSVTEISKLDSGTPITYQELLEFDGHLNVQLSDNNGTIASQADIGHNALTGRFQQFILLEGDVAGAGGMLTIEERASGFSLLTVELDGGMPDEQHPTTLNFGSILQTAGVAVNLNPVDGTIGLGRTHLEELDGALLAPYSALVNFQGFIRVHLGNGNEMNTVLAEGNIAYSDN